LNISDDNPQIFSGIWATMYISISRSSFQVRWFIVLSVVYRQYNRTSRNDLAIIGFFIYLNKIYMKQPKRYNARGYITTKLY